MLFDPYINSGKRTQRERKQAYAEQSFVTVTGSNHYPKFIIDAIKAHIQQSCTGNLLYTSY